MTAKHWISTETVCTHYEIEYSFVQSLSNMGLIQIEIIERDQCIHQDQIGDLEKIIRLNQELKVNLEGIDVIFNLLEKEKELRRELKSLKNRLSLYDDESAD